MGLIQESKAEKALDALSKLAAPSAKVKREGKIKEVPSIEVVPGDIVLLETGNFVPADCRIIESTALAIEESALTGEALPVNKDCETVLDRDILTADIRNMAFATTTVTKGHGIGVVCDTGMKTKVGQIAKLILSDESPETPLQKKLRRSWKEARFDCPRNMLFNFHNRNTKEDTLDGNVYDICWTSCCSNS